MTSKSDFKNYTRVVSCFNLKHYTFIYLNCNFKKANDYNEAFGDDYVQIFDGQEIMSNPQDEYGLLLDYFGLDKSELEWTFNKEKGFHCLSYPVNYCLGKK